MILRPMSVYYCAYTNFHHDPNPCLFVLHSTMQYTEGLNIRYLPPYRRFAFFGMLRQLMMVGGGTMSYNGKILYEIIKRNYPDFSKVSYRKYFSYYLTGVAINEGLNPVSPLMELYIKTQNLVAQSTSNYMHMKAKNDSVVNEVNRILYDKRTKEMQNLENMGNTGGGTSTPPGSIMP